MLRKNFDLIFISIYNLFDYLDMLNNIPGFEPVQGRRRADNTTQSSSRRDNYNVAVSSPTKPALRKTETQQFEKNIQRTQQDTNIEAFTSPKQKNQPRGGQTQSQQQIASPAIKNLKFAQVAKDPDAMTGSTVYMRKSSRVPQMADNSTDMAYKLKLLGFIVVSILLILNAMTPSRKCKYYYKK